MLFQLLLFHLQDFPQPPPVALFVGKAGAEKGAHQFVGEFDADDAAAQAEHVHVVMFDSLVR